MTFEPTAKVKIILVVWHVKQISLTYDVVYDSYFAH